eukprot:328431-Chlamydomonas_euryale.AAC.1
MQRAKPEAKLRPHTRWTKKHDDAITAPRQLVPTTAPYPAPASTTLHHAAHQAPVGSPSHSRSTVSTGAVVQEGNTRY